MNDTTIVTAHYGTDDFVARVEQALAAAGFAEGPVPAEVLAPLDQFHAGGAASTAAVAGRMGLTPGMRVLDVGSGLGGPARQLAAAHGVNVIGIDLNPAYVAVAAALTRRAGLADRVAFETGDATSLPYPDGSFDAALTQHVVMNIADRAGLYANIHRVLRPGARFGMFDAVAGTAGDLQFPVPWARDPSGSFLLSLDQTRAALETAGFNVLVWQDITDTALPQLAAQVAAAQQRPEHLRPLALPLIMGADFPALATNFGRNLREGRARLLLAVVERPV